MKWHHLENTTPNSQELFCYLQVHHLKFKNCYRLCWANYGSCHQKNIINCKAMAYSLILVSHVNVRMILIYNLNTNCYSLYSYCQRINYDIQKNISARFPYSMNLLLLSDKFLIVCIPYRMYR